MSSFDLGVMSLASSSRSSSEHRRRVSGKYQYSSYGRIEPILYAIKFQFSISGEEMYSVVGKDYSSGECWLFETLSGHMLLPKPRLQLSFNGKNIDPLSRRPLCQVFHFQRSVTIRVTVLQPRCEICNQVGILEEMTVDTWTHLPTIHCGRGLYRDYGYRIIRLWQRLVERMLF